VVKNRIFNFDLITPSAKRSLLSNVIVRFFSLDFQSSTKSPSTTSENAAEPVVSLNREKIRAEYKLRPSLTIRRRKGGKPTA
jgi:hypothetical protein